MKVLRLALINYKRMVKDIGNIGFIFIMPLIIIMGVYFVTNSTGKIMDVNVAFNVLDRGNYGDEMLRELKISKNIFHNNKKDALKLLEKNDVMAVYTLPQDFSKSIDLGQKPVIQSYKTEKGNATLPVEIAMNDNINKKIKEQVLIKNKLINDKKDLYSLKVKTNLIKNIKGIQEKLFLAAFLIIYFIILSANVVGGEILSQRKNKVLSRAITTANKGYEIIGSIYLAMFFLQVSINLAVLLIGKFILGYSLVHFDVIAVNIILASLVSISLGLFITRIIGSPEMASLTLTLIVVATTLLSTIAIAGDSIRKMPWMLQNLSKFTPQYWLVDSLNRSNIFPNVFVLLLMALALFTAGNFRVKNFINKA